MGFRNHLFYCLWMLTNTEIAARGDGAVRIGSAGGRSIRTGRVPSRYWDSAVPLADSLGSAAAMDMPSSPSISAGSVISGQMARHVHMCCVEMTTTRRRGVRLGYSA